jgi:hypothetical protein
MNIGHVCLKHSCLVLPSVIVNDGRDWYSSEDAIYAEEVSSRMNRVVILLRTPATFSWVAEPRAQIPREQP